MLIHGIKTRPAASLRRPVVKSFAVYKRGSTFRSAALIVNPRRTRARQLLSLSLSHEEPEFKDAALLWVFWT